MNTLFLMALVITPIGFFLFGLGLVDEAIRYVAERGRSRRRKQVAVSDITLAQAFGEFTGSEENHA